MKFYDINCILTTLLFLITHSLLNKPGCVTIPKKIQKSTFTTVKHIMFLYGYCSKHQLRHKCTQQFTASTERYKTSICITKINNLILRSMIWKQKHSKSLARSGEQLARLTQLCRFHKFQLTGCLDRGDYFCLRHGVQILEKLSVPSLLAPSPQPPDPPNINNTRQNWFPRRPSPRVTPSPNLTKTSLTRFGSCERDYFLSSKGARNTFNVWEDVFG